MLFLAHNKIEIIVFFITSSHALSNPTTKLLRFLFPNTLHQVNPSPLPQIYYPLSHCNSIALIPTPPLPSTPSLILPNLCGSTKSFVDLVEQHFYDGIEIQRYPEGPAEGFIDPSTEKIRLIPLEIRVTGNKTPFYGSTLEAQVINPFKAFGTMAMARELLQKSELTPRNSNILDGMYAVFGYVTQNEDFLAAFKVGGDVIKSIQVVSGLENLANPSYKIAS
ncbi:hypothetical protein AALP_AAs42893U000300 [Arabis alpina]|uniref:peptidylprolyl isomerase n=1 Tax=Arabis alpina TaxID=50452 RepID=A0A087FX81_ARAAL|nr:hypothetical protein AALP_AAs42893U000300 [Arabis alpina]